jgi:hypothetical protein
LPFELERQEEHAALLSSRATLAADALDEQFAQFAGAEIRAIKKDLDTSGCFDLGLIWTWRRFRLFPCHLEERCLKVIAQRPRIEEDQSLKSDRATQQRWLWCVRLFTIAI